LHAQRANVGSRVLNVRFVKAAFTPAKPRAFFGEPRATTCGKPVGNFGLPQAPLRAVGFGFAFQPAKFTR
jgi:hypothetical protein